MKRALLLILLAFFLLGADACPAEPEEAETEEIGTPPEFPEVPEPDKQ